MPRPRFKTARCILYRPLRDRSQHADPDTSHRVDEFEYLLAIHGSFWARKVKRWGLPGGRIEWREDPVEAARRELQEELEIDIEDYEVLGDYKYKHAWHKVIVAPWEPDIVEFDTRELLEIRWFSLPQIEQLASERLLHANYEHDAVAELAKRLQPR